MWWVLGYKLTSESIVADTNVPHVRETRSIGAIFL